MTPFESYKEYLKVKNHFNIVKYDYFKTKTNFKLETFENRKDKNFFFKIAKKPNLPYFLACNFVRNQKVWIKDLSYSSACDKNYTEFQKKMESLSYYIKEELNKTSCSFDELFKCHENDHPILLKHFLADEISIETLCVLLDVASALDYWNKKMEHDVIWNSIHFKVIKYIPFLSYDKDNITQNILDFYSE